MDRQKEKKKRGERRLYYDIIRLTYFIQSTAKFDTAYSIDIYIYHGLDTSLHFRRFLLRIIENDISRERKDFFFFFSF